MKRNEYLEILKAKTGVEKKYIDEVVKEYIELLKLQIIKTKRANITNFGTFSLKTTKPHIIFSPIDGKQIKSKGVNKIYFSMSKDLQNKL